NCKGFCNALSVSDISSDTNRYHHLEIPDLGSGLDRGAGSVSGRGRRCGRSRGRSCGCAGAVPRTARGVSRLRRRELIGAGPRCGRRRLPFRERWCTRSRPAPRGDTEAF
ncbi:MAG: hypothetical protein ACK56F_15520, partial [bacterium]